MKVLFLDIDGVLNSMKSCCAYGGFPFELDDPSFDDIAIKLLQRLCDSSGVQIVLSSSWRICHNWKDVGAAFDLPIIGATDAVAGIRGEQIGRWLAQHPEVKQYAIIDDDDDMLDEQRSRFVRTDVYEGFTWKDYCKLCGIFGEEPWAGEVRDRSWTVRTSLSGGWTT